MGSEEKNGRNDSEEARVAEEESRGVSPKRKRRWIVGGTVVAVIIVAAVGFQIWHQQPSFCNAVCHTPMDSYVEGYSHDDDNVLASLHRREGNLQCLDCHKATLGEQVGEAGKWVTGSYTVPLEDTHIGTREFCQNGNCHGSDEELAEKTADYNPPYNPHDPGDHASGLDCYQCHSMHGTSKYYCTKCHEGLKLPEGWEAESMY